MFKLHPQLEKDTFFVFDLPLCKVLLMNNALFPWLILVPAKPDLREIIDLSAKDRTTLMEEISRISELMRDRFNPDKLNIAALGNMVSQLHIHIIVRYKTDPAWPSPVWGKDSRPYDDTEKEKIISLLTDV